MALSLLHNQTKESELIDDLESVFWVLLYTALHHVKQTDLAAILDYEHSGFDCGNELLVRGKALKTSAIARANAISREHLAKLSFLCPPFHKFVLGLATEWCAYYSLYDSVATFPDDEHMRTRYEAARDRLSSPMWLLAKINETLLVTDGWLDDDFVADQIPQKTEQQDDFLEATLGTIGCDISHLTKSNAKAYKKALTTQLAQRMGAVGFHTAGVKRLIEGIANDPEEDAAADAPPKKRHRHQGTSVTVERRNDK